MQKSELNRGQFLKQLGMSSKALMAFYCMGTLAACSSDDGVEPQGNNNPGGQQGTSNAIVGNSTGSNINFTLDLTDANFSKLKTDGAFDYAGDVIIANVGSESYIALSKKCPHQGTSVEYRKDNNDFRCPNHGSEFATSGAVTKSPAGSGLTVFKVVLSADKNTLSISA
ncbi:Rieske 2Fe-2S domain-containing protein [uncultured Arcticibacterium sp.]|uniref:QcrA and Rieske domain-containing protein n=1 Tax=uncultured Arcticibacterium sp. TaxID=2173042 RepID=UPI0030FC1AF0